MKRFIAVLLSVLMVFTFVACTDNTNNANNQNSFVETYKSKATEYIEGGDIDSAIKVLEEGVTKTNSEELKKMLEELKKDVVGSTQKDESSVEGSKTEDVSEPSDNVDTTPDAVSPNENKTFDMTDYVGFWNETESLYTTGGMQLYIYDDGDFLSFNLSLSQTNCIRVADTYISVLKEDIKSNIIKSVFTDSFENCGVANIEFLEDKIICTISNLQEPADGADWGIYDGEYILKYHETEH